MLDETTADLAWTLILAVARRLVEADAVARSGQWRGWNLDQFCGTDVWGKTLGILGFGRIGRAVARRARGFDMRVIYHSRHRAPADVEKELNAEYLPLDERAGAGRLPEPARAAHAGNARPHRPARSSPK